MKPVEQMTLDECRDELARAKGWEQIGHFWYGHGRVVSAPDAAIRAVQIPSSPDHPIPATLDAIAQAMPEGFRLEVGHAYGGQSGWYALGNRTSKNWVGRADTELLARARLACACWRASKEKS
jgi:hypothetical protein